MYLACNSKMSRDQINQMFVNLLIDPQFEQWNTKTISIMLVYSFGYSGQEFKEYSIKLLEEFKTCFGSADFLIIPNIYFSRDKQEDIIAMPPERFVKELQIKYPNTVY